MKFSHEYWMSRCFSLAQKSKGQVSPNPLVGAVIVYKNRIIGEGRHEFFGGPHAEINALKSVKNNDLTLLKHATIYVNLEPCDHHGKTGPCSVALIKSKIPKIVISNIDPFEKVNQKGIQRLKNANIEVITGILDIEGFILNRSFFTFHKMKRPFITLKWAQTNNFFIGQKDQQIKISNSFSQINSHKWRSQIDAILIGTNTAIIDNPSLNTRHFSGKSPLRVIIDLNNRIPQTHNIIKDDSPTLFFCHKNYPFATNSKKIIHIVKDKSQLIDSILTKLFKLNIQSLLIEGGAQTHQSFIDSDLWDEARIINSKNKHLEEGIKCPKLKGLKIGTQSLGDDQIEYIFHERYENFIPLPESSHLVF